MTKKTAAAVLLLGILAGACGGDTKDTSSNASSGPSSSTTEAAPTTAPCRSGGEGTYSTKVGSATATIRVFGDADADLVRLAKRVGVEEPTAFVDVDVDNSSGTTPASVGAIDLVDDAGARVKVTAARDVVGGWQDRASSSDSGLYNELVAAYNARLDPGFALPGEKSTSTYVAERRPASVKNVLVDGARACLG